MKLRQSCPALAALLIAIVGAVLSTTWQEVPAETRLAASWSHRAA